MSDETLAVDEWLYATMAADASIGALVADRIYAEVAPADATFPLIITTHLSSTDVRAATQQSRIMVSGLWLVKGVVNDSSFNNTLKAIAERIDALFHASSGGTADGGGAAIFTSHREQPFRLAEVESGKQYRHLGGQFRIYAQG